VPQRVLAAALERHRTMAGLGREEAADALGWSAMKLYRIETARVTVSARGIQELARLYGLDDTGREALALMIHADGWLAWDGG
jgi:transcriptional regulator with XRE-family HTH domain